MRPACVACFLGKQDRARQQRRAAASGRCLLGGVAERDVGKYIPIPAPQYSSSSGGRCVKSGVRVAQYVCLR